MIKCVKCGHEWENIVEKPAHCPSCKFRRYDGRESLQPGFSIAMAMKKKQEMFGRKFGKLTVDTFVSRYVGYSCKCECGEFTKATSSQLKLGKRTSCGCGLGTPKPDNLSAKNSLFKEYMNGAKLRKYDFEITFDHFVTMITSPCHYCDLAHSMHGRNRNKEFKYNGIDRIYNKIGYTKENCVPCCKVCNKLKMDLSYDEWLSAILRISKSKWFKNEELNTNEA